MLPVLALLFCIFRFCFLFCYFCYFRGLNALLNRKDKNRQTDLNFLTCTVATQYRDKEAEFVRYIAIVRYIVIIDRGSFSYMLL